ncbi:MAG: Cyclic di-GMP phosphodieSPTERase [Firmicutes bacterium]|nr:Cyclic di-GMP phosphodieSPTERase [Bacillota bacterium]
MHEIQTFCQAIGERDSYTMKHSMKVAGLMAGFAEYVELPGDDVTLAYLIGIVHDIGKVGVPSHILNKAGRLTAEEFSVIKQHPDIGARLLAKMDGLEKVAEVVRHHHERYDGTGYGQGLAGEEIPFFSRMLSLCDAFDAMTSSRCYRWKPLSTNSALEEIASCAGTQFDPELSRDFADFIKAQSALGKLASSGV